MGDDGVLRLRPEATALVVIDLQLKLLPAVLEPERVLANTRLLLRTAQLLGLPLLLTTQYQRGLGATDPGVLELAGVEPLDKTSFGCFGHQPFCDALEQLPPGRRTLLVAGIETHICVLQTVLGALGAGRPVCVVADATSSRGARDHELGLARMERSGAVLVSTEMAVYELLGRSDSDAFRALLPELRQRQG